MWPDLRKDFAALTDGDSRTLPQARWVVIRIFRHDQLSEYWDEDRQEAIGGPKYRYDDFTVRALVKPGGSISVTPAFPALADPVFNAGVDDVEYQVYGIAWEPRLTRIPTDGDLIYEIDKYASFERPLPPLQVTDRYKIVGKLKATGDYGRSEGLFFVTERIQGES